MVPKITLKNKLDFLISCILKTAIFTTLILSIYGLFFHYSTTGNLLYYKGILVILSLFLTIFIIIFFRNNFEKNLPPLIIATLLIYSFHVTVPVILDRSISVQIIGSLYNKDSSIAEINQKFLEGYIDDYSTTCRRLDEQISTGNVIILDNHEMALTQRGRIMRNIFNFIVEFLKIEDHYIKGKLDNKYIHHYDFIDEKCVQQ